MPKARLWLEEGSAYSTRAVSDKRLNVIVGVLDRCSRDADNGTWGCFDCGEFSECCRLYGNMVHKSIIKLLREDDSRYFNTKFATILGKLKEIAL